MLRRDKSRRAGSLKMVFGLFITAILLVVLTGCGKDSPFVGKWKIESANMMGQQIAIEDLGALYLDIRSDGTCIVGDEIDDEPTEEYAWTEEDAKLHIALEIEGESAELIGKIQDGKLVFDEWLGLPAELVFKRS